MTDNIKYNKDPDSTDLLLRSKEMDLESGWLGKFFGAPTHSPLNIAGLLIILLVLTGIAVSFIYGISDSINYWSKILPLITLALGYVFGKKP